MIKVLSGYDDEGKRAGLNRHEESHENVCIGIFDLCFTRITHTVIHHCR